MSRRKQSYPANPDVPEPDDRRENPTNEEHGCACNDACLPTMDDMGFTAIDRVILDLARCFCEGYANGSIDAWEDACRIADDRLGIVDGPAFAARVLALVRGMRGERAHIFGYMPAGCQRVSEDEHDLMALVHAAGGERADIRLAFDRLVSVPWPERTLLAARALSALCARYQASQPATGTATPRRPPRMLN